MGLLVCTILVLFYFVVLAMLICYVTLNSNRAHPVLSVLDSTVILSDDACMFVVGVGGRCLFAAVNTVACVANQWSYNGSADLFNCRCLTCQHGHFSSTC